MNPKFAEKYILLHNSPGAVNTNIPVKRKLLHSGVLWCVCFAILILLLYLISERLLYSFTLFYFVVFLAIPFIGFLATRTRMRDIDELSELSDDASDHTVMCKLRMLTYRAYRRHIVIGVTAVFFVNRTMNDRPVLGMILAGIVLLALFILYYFVSVVFYKIHLLNKHCSYLINWEDRRYTLLDDSSATHPKRYASIIAVVLFVLIAFVGVFLVTSSESELRQNTSLAMVDWETTKASPVYDFSDINLLAHDLIDRDLFITHIFTDEETGATYSVPIIAVGQIEQDEPRRVVSSWTNELEVIHMNYSLWPSPDVLDSLSALIEHDILQRNRQGLASNATVPLRINYESNTAFFVLNFERPGEPYFITIIYLSQAVPGSNNTIALRLMLSSFTNWSEQGATLIDELSNHIGIDLAAHIP